MPGTIHRGVIHFVCLKQFILWKNDPQVEIRGAPELQKVQTFHRVRKTILQLIYVVRLEHSVTIRAWLKNDPVVKICYAPTTIHRVSAIGIFWRVVRKTTLKWKYVVRQERFIFEKRSANGIWQTVAPWNNSCGWKAILERLLPETEWGLGVYALEFD